jgi:phosphoribosyl-dephospho-CoA transferase
MCSRFIVSQHARIGVSGPEVIETNKGVEEFDSTDRGLVWRITGGRSVPFWVAQTATSRTGSRISAQLRSTCLGKPRHFRRQRSPPNSGASRTGCSILESAVTHPRSGGRPAFASPTALPTSVKSDDINMVPVGVPLPPAAGKSRIAVNIPREAVIARAAPPGSRTAARTAQPAWQSTIAALLVLGKQHGIEPAAFGSLLWEHHTGLSYLSTTSHLDLIWPAHASCGIASLLDGIARIERAAPMRIDGEIVFRQGAAANWPELRKALGDDGRGEILVKTMGGARVFNARCLPGSEHVQ